MVSLNTKPPESFSARRRSSLAEIVRCFTISSQLWADLLLAAGIGRAVAVMFSLEGADVAIVYLPEEEADAQETKKFIEAAGRVCLCIPQDIREEQGCKNVIEKVVATFGKIDVWVY